MSNSGVQYLAGIVLNVKNYGAIGNGIADDTTAIQDAVTAAQATTGAVVFIPAGTYKVSSIVTAQSFTQPRIIGAGSRLTILNGSGTAPIFSFTGGSGSLGEGSVSDIGFTGASATGIQFNGVDGFTVERCRFYSLASGVQFYNGASGSFTEFCVVKDSTFESTVTLPVEYKVNAGNNSFHGSGLEDCVITQSSTATNAVIKVNSGCDVYQAPMGVTIFANSSTQALILIASANTLPLLTLGDLNVEGAGTLIDAASTAVMIHTGTIQSNNQNFVWGHSFYQASITQQNSDGSISSVYNQQRTVSLSNAASPGVVIMDLPQRGSYLIHVYITATNYDYDYLLYVTQSLYNPNGNVTVLANPISNNVAAYGAPTFSVQNYQLSVTNTTYPASGVTAYVAMETSGTQLGANFTH